MAEAPVSFSTLTFVSKIMNALAVLVFVVIAGYDSSVMVTASMQNTIYAAITLVPAASCLVSIVPFLFYRLGDPAERDPLAGSRAAA